jgi:hypothetical protein
LPKLRSCRELIEPLAKRFSLRSEIIMTKTSKIKLIRLGSATRLTRGIGGDFVETALTKQPSPMA